MTGIGAVGGMALAKVRMIDEDAPLIVKRNIDDPNKEYLRLLTAKEAAEAQLRKIMEENAESLGKDNSEILDYQLLMLEDTEFLNKIKGIIDSGFVNCEYALDIAARYYMDLISKSDDSYLRERAADIEDLAGRLNFALSGRVMRTLSEIRTESIVAAADLTPSQMAGVDREKVRGIVLERGGMSSHVVIIARSLGIPCIIGVTGLMSSIAEGELLLIDGNTGEVTRAPDRDALDRFETFRKNSENESRLLAEYVNTTGITRDGTKVRVCGNIASDSEAAALVKNGGEGAGLFRTEYLYLKGSSMPSEELQYSVYSNAARILDGRPLVIRTLDAGGDKNIPYLKIPEEDNPYLGYRAIRYCLGNPDVFKAQLSAILRAGVLGNVSLMLPMITTVDEVRRTRLILEEVKKELSERKIDFTGSVPVGIMVETPAAAAMAESFAKEVDFFSIGTNDLTQYLFAADRTNHKVAGLNSCYQPALLKTVKYICDCAHRHGIEVDICGQAGEVPALVPIWAAMGVECLSVGIPSIPKVRRIICETVKSEALAVMEKALSMDTAEEVESFLTLKFETLVSGQKDCLPPNPTAEGVGT